MGFSGSLSTIPLSSIIQLLCGEDKTGILKVFNEDTEFQIFFWEGSVTYAVETRKPARLVELMTKAGILNKQQVKECMDEAKKRKQAFGKTVVELKYTSFETLKFFIYKQVTEIMCQLFQWADGEFNYSDSQLNSRWMDIVDLNTLKITMDALRLVDEKREFVVSGKIE
jgi:hypothetical protein